MDKNSKKKLEIKLQNDLKKKLKKKLKKQLEKEIKEYPVNLKLNLYLNVEQNPEQIAVGDVDNAAIAIKHSNAVDRAHHSAVSQDKSKAVNKPVGKGKPCNSHLASETNNTTIDPINDLVPIETNQTADVPDLEAPTNNEPDNQELESENQTLSQPSVNVQRNKRLITRKLPAAPPPLVENPISQPIRIW